MTYISGPITGRPDYNRAAFEAAALRLLSQGQAVHNPCDPSKVHPSKTWADYMRDDIVHLMHCDRIYMLTGWPLSLGSVTEFFLALILQIPVDFEGVKCARNDSLRAYWRFLCHLWRVVRPYRRRNRNLPHRSK